MADVFVSHVEEDSAVALQIADALEAAGWSTWCYERDSVPGPSYLVQTGQAVEDCQAVVVVISPHSLGSHQVTVEVVRGHESAKPFVPVLVGLPHVELASRQPEWREAIGAATSIAVPRGGVAEILPRIVRGVQGLGITPSGVPGEQHAAPSAFAPVPRRSSAARLLRLPPWQRVALVVALLAVAVGVVLVTRSGGGGKSASPGPVTPTGPGTSVGPVPGPAVDADTTPLRTQQGDARIASAGLTSELCPPPGFPGPCRHPAQNLFLVLTIEGWTGGRLTIALSSESNESYVLIDGHRYNAGIYGDETGGVVRVVYAGVPASAAGRDGELVWPGNPRITVRVRA